MEQLSNNKQNGMVIIAMLFVAMLAQCVLLADKIFGHSFLSWWWVWSPSLFVLACIMCVVFYFAIRIIIIELKEFYNERLQRRD